MKNPPAKTLIPLLTSLGVFIAWAPGAGAAATSETQDAKKTISSWHEQPRLGAEEMIAKYGPPQEVTADQLVWHKAGPYKRITVFNLETPHDFPLPHVDFLEHTIEYNVPQDKVGDLIAFDGSSTINRTTGELSARCDLEAHNVLTLNLDHDIVTGKKTVAQARQAFAEIVGQEVLAKHPQYEESLLFKPAAPMTAAFSDKPSVPGAPVRAADMDADAKAKLSAETSKKGDAEILATVAAVDLNEIRAAGAAGTKKLSPSVAEYARMLHEEHGKNLDATLKLGQQIKVTPLETTAVGEKKKAGAAELAELVPLDGKEFESGFLDAMVKGHTQVLSDIDGKLLGAADDPALKKHLQDTRAHVAMHLEQAKKLQKGSEVAER